jgi:hypothetical protein
MSPNITDPATRAKVAAVEGEGWLDQQDMTGGLGNYSHALVIWQVDVDRAIALAVEFNDEACLDDHESTRAVIYGSGGWTRYFVRLNGDLVFSASHSEAHLEQRARAKELGFRIE